MKKLLLIVVLGLLLSGNAHAKDLRLICTSKNGAIDIVTIIIEKEKALMIIMNSKLTTGSVKITPNVYQITGNFVSDDSTIIAQYKYIIRRHSGDFSNEMHFGTSEVNFYGSCLEDKVKF